MSPAYDTVDPRKAGHMAKTMAKTILMDRSTFLSCRCKAIIVQTKPPCLKPESKIGLTTLITKHWKLQNEGAARFRNGYLTVLSRGAMCGQSGYITRTVSRFPNAQCWDQNQKWLPDTNRLGGPCEGYITLLSQGYPTLLG